MVSLPGIPHGHITLLRGHSDTGKTTALLEVAVNAQKMGILPVFIVTEMKWSWEHAQMMGLQVDVEKDNEGKISGVDGNFIFADRGQLPTVEAVAGFMADLMNEQKKGKDIDTILDETDIFDEFEIILPDEEFPIFVITILNGFQSDVIVNKLLDVIQGCSRGE